MKTVRILFSCTGVGIFNRGIESFFRESFDGLKHMPGIEVRLLKGAGESSYNEFAIWNINRTSSIAPIIGRLFNRNEYVIEQWSSFLPVINQIRRYRPHVIFYSDSNLGFLLYWFRRQIGVPYRLLFSNGGPCRPPFVRTDYVHQVAPFYYKQAIQASEPPQKHFMVPYGIEIPQDELIMNRDSVSALRKQLKLPTDRPIVISVGAIDPNSHKRMSYLISEVSALPEPRPYLVMLGQILLGSNQIVEQATHLLGIDNFTARSVPYERVKAYYQTADIFALASLSEGFGRVFLEALMYGLPCLVHDHPVMRYVLDSHGTFADLSKPDALASQLFLLLHSDEGKPDRASNKRNYVRDKFSWPTLASQYVEMFRDCSQFSNS